MKSFVGTLVAISLLQSASAANWPQWRGEDGLGITSETNLPMHWSVTENLRWKTALPDRGNSTPIVWGNKIFLTQAIEGEHRRLVMCFDRSNGKKLWEAGTTYAGPDK